MGEVIAIASGKGGVGKTTATANLGLGLARLEKKVVVVDTDLGLRNLDLSLGLENVIIYNFIDVITGFCQLNDALVQNPAYENLYLLPAAQTKVKAAVKAEQVDSFIQKLQESFDYILLDCPAGVEDGLLNFLGPAQRILIMTTPHAAALRAADKMISLIRPLGKKEMGLIVNRIRCDLLEKGEITSPNEIKELLPIDLIGLIPEDDQVLLGTEKGKPVITGESPAAKAYQNISRRISGEQVDFLSLQTPEPEKKRSWLYRLFH